MKLLSSLNSFWIVFALALGLATATAEKVSAQENPSANQLEIYSKIKSFALTGGVVDVKDLVVKKDRVQITLTGTVYLTEPIAGRITGAVFTGTGKFSVETPPNEFEKANVKRLLGVEAIESDFNTAVFRFTDDTALAFGQTRPDGGANERAQKKGHEVEQRILKETGANLAARVALSLQNSEKPGFFFANFDGGKRGRFSFVLDYQCRIPLANFGINGGEKGLIWSYKSSFLDNEIWLGFYSLQDYQRGQVEYSDFNDQIDISNYDMEVDLREHKKRVRIVARLDAVSLQPNVRALSFLVGNDLDEYENYRLTKQLRIKSARRGERELSFAQEDWEGGFTIFLDEPLSAGQKVPLDLILEGDFMSDSSVVANAHYPRSNTSWFPHHGYLDRATFNLTFKHPKRLLIASVGARTSESPDPDDKDTLITKYEMAFPVAGVTFALAAFKRHTDFIKWKKGGSPTPLEFNSVEGDFLKINEDFVLAELNNSIRYFSVLFGDYPYPTFGAAFHPFNFGQGFPTLLMIPRTDRDNIRNFQFIAHETSHQWWGHIVLWRSYRDQWLSEGFAEYSGFLYAGARMNRDGMESSLRKLRLSLTEPPETQSGQGKGRLTDVGPIILGHRLATSKTIDAYNTLVYNKGALVLRMLHFMLSDPGSGDSKAFFNMMTDFVNRYRNKTASTDDFRNVVNEHFAKSQLAQTYNIRDLNWLFSQYVYDTALPSYELEYKVKDLPDGKAVVSGTISQINAPSNWGGVLPITFSFAGKQEAVGTVLVKGAYSPFEIPLPMRPKKVELDPERWILSEKTSTKGN